MIKKALLIFVYALLLNFAWENAHSYLYFHPNGEPITQAMLLRATLFDAVFIALLGIVFMKVTYLRERKWYALLFGIVVAIWIELLALKSGRWAYNDFMPIIPLLNTGLTPTIQLGVLSYSIFSMIGIETTKKENKKLFQCPECGLHYEEEALAKKCEAWCKEYKSCNLQITKHSMESIRAVEGK